MIVLSETLKGIHFWEMYEFWKGSNHDEFLIMAFEKFGI